MRWIDASDMLHLPVLRIVYDKVGRPFDKIAAVATFSQLARQILSSLVLYKSKPSCLARQIRAKLHWVLRADATCG